MQTADTSNETAADRERREQDALSYNVDHLDIGNRCDPSQTTNQDEYHRGRAGASRNDDADRDEDDLELQDYLAEEEFENQLREGEREFPYWY